MFGSFRRKVTQQTIDMVRQPFAMFQHIYGIPSAFWQDEFVIGFFGVMIVFVSDYVSQGRLSTSDKGFVLQETFTSLSNMNGATIARRFTELTYQQPQSSDFKLGGDNGEIITMALIGKLTPLGREILEKSPERTALQAEYGEQGAAATILFQTLLVQPLIKRFDLSDE